MTQTVLMGDPAHFHISGGANPFTRTWWGKKKSVHRHRAIEQWHHLKDLLTSLGVRVLVIPPDEAHPGLVYPANAGVLLGDTFILSNLLPSRAGERPIYETFLRSHGVKTGSVQSRFEGEADFFPVGDRWVLTHGRVVQQRFVPRFGIPPWKRVYGFRTDLKAIDELRPYAGGKEIIPLELSRETHYHGDTVFCSFGSRREFLLAFLEALSPASRKKCLDVFGGNVIPLNHSDAFHYAANSFQVSSGDALKLIMPDGVSEALLREIEARGVQPVPVDVGEFLKKGGGAVKCMIGDLGFR